MDDLRYEVPEDGVERVDKLEHILEEIQRLLEEARWDVTEGYDEDDPDEWHGIEDDEF